MFIMRKIVVAFLIALLIPLYMTAQNSVESNIDELDWFQKFEKAEKFSKNKNKPMLIFFTGSDWCGPCKKLEKDFFSSSEFKTIADKEFVLYKADFPRNLDLVSDSQRESNIELKSKYKVSSYPTLVFVDNKGNILGSRKGYNLMRDTSYHFQLLKEVLNKI